MPITQDMLDKLDPDKKQQAMQIIEELKRRGVDPSIDTPIQQPQPIQGILPKVMGGVQGLLRSRLPVDTQLKMAQTDLYGRRDTPEDSQTSINNFLAKEQAKIKLQQMEDEQDPVKQLARKNAEFELGVGQPSSAVSPISKPISTELSQEQPAQASSEPQRYIVDPSKITRINPQGLVPNVNYEKQRDAYEQKKLSIDKIKQSAQDRLNTIATIEKGINYFGPYGKTSSLVTSIGGLNKEEYNKRKTWENAVNRLLAQLGFDMMTELKNASRTGATGLGQLSEKEGEWLRQASTELTRDVSPERAKEILNEMKRLHKKVLQGDMTSNVNSPVMDERSQAKQILIDKGYSDEEAEQLLGD